MYTGYLVSEEERQKETRSRRKEEKNRPTVWEGVNRKER